MRRRAAIGLTVIALAALVHGAHAESAPDTTARDTLARVVTLPVVEVSTTRSSDKLPVARTVIGREEIARRNWGQDTPMALATLPGAYAYSDAGNGIGYSYLAIRAFPQRRISVLIDGVPLNDPESHEVYWIDHPDLLASTSEAQVQRGVGSALYGAASLGGSVNLETAPMSEAPESRAILAYGSYATKRAMVETSSGPLAGGWNFYGRYSRIETDGYRDQSDTELWAYTFSARKLFGHHSVRLNLFGGPETTHLAYLGVPREYLDGAITGDAARDRRFNPLTYPGERDHFFEPHYELVHTWAPAPGLALTHTLFYFDGQGYYDEQRAGQTLSDYRLSPWVTSDSTLFPHAYYRDSDGDGALDRDAQGRVTVERFDLVRRRFIENQHYGWVPRLRIEHAGGALTLGGEIRAHDGHHVGTVIGGSGLPPGTEPDHAYYDYHPRTLASGLFMREEWQPRGDLTVTGDLGWRHQSYTMRGDRFDGIRFDQAYDFALPRLGVTLVPRRDVTVFASWALARREPAFRDLFDGEGTGSVPLIVNGSPLVRPERVNDWELGGAWSRTIDRRQIALSANLFEMELRDELVYAGQFNTDLGYPIIGNAARSIHRGLELAGRAAAPIRGFDAALEGNATLGDNHFVRYTEHYGPTPADDVSYDGKRIGFFPNVMANVSARLGWRGATLGVDAQHSGRIFLDNTETMTASIGPRTVLNVVGGWRHALGGAEAELRLRVFNALDERYATSGYMDYDALGNLAPQFVPAATRNALGEIEVRF